MRTIKDPKQKPEVVRKRLVVEEVAEVISPEDTPPKKRKSPKKKEEDEGLNDSGSTVIVDNHSDVLSEKSSVVGEDEGSEVSSVKSTPPKKRALNQKKAKDVVIKGPEVNGDLNDHEKLESEEKIPVDNKPKGKKLTKKQKEKQEGLNKCDRTGETGNSEILDVHLPEKAVDKTPPKKRKEAYGKGDDVECNSTVTSKVEGTDKNPDICADSLPKKPVKKPKKGTKQAENEIIKDDSVKEQGKKKANSRKRKLVENTETQSSENGEVKNKTVKKKAAPGENDTIGDKDQKPSPPKPKKPRKSKKQLEKEKAERELKRQLEEQRNSRANKDEEKTEEKAAGQEQRETTDTVTKNGKETEVKVKKKRKPKKKVEKETNDSSIKKENGVSNSGKAIGEIETKTCNGSIDDTEGDLGCVVSIGETGIKCSTAGAVSIPVDSVLLEQAKTIDVALNIGTQGLEDINHEGQTVKLGVREPDDIDDTDGNLNSSFESEASKFDLDTEVGTENKENDGESNLLAVDAEANDGESDQKIIISCEHCGHKSKSKGGHTRHLRKCQPHQFNLDSDGPSKSKTHQCENCEYTAPRRVLVINHMKIHGIFQCKRCKFRTDTEEELDEHSATEHKDRSECKFCKLCNRYVKCNEVPLETHKETCQGRVPFKCPECEKEFQYESSLKCHVVSHYPDKPKLFSCNECDYKSNYKANLKKHIRHIHQQNKERNIKCPDCDKLFFSEDNMRRHAKLHSEERPFKCTETDCEKAFKTINGLRSHAVSHTTEKLFPCDHEGCTKEFKCKKSLNFHVDEVHNMVPKTFTCSVEGCGMAFHKKTHLERHVASHTGEKKVACTWPTCTKSFKNMDIMKIHYLRHTNEKPIKCQHCSFACRQKNSLQFHMKKKHPDLVKTLPDKSVPVKLDKEPGEGAVSAVEPSPEVKVDQSGGEPAEKPASVGEASGSETSIKPAPKRTDLYEFQSEEESGDEMQPGLLRKEIDKDKPILPPVGNTVDLKLVPDLDLVPADEDLTGEQGVQEPKKKTKVKKKPGPKPKAEKEQVVKDPEPKPKKRGRKKKEVVEVKKEEDAEKEVKKAEETTKKAKPKKRAGSPKGKKQAAPIKTEDPVEEETSPPAKSPKKKRGPKKKVQVQPEEEKVVEKEVEKPKKNGRKRGKKDTPEKNPDNIVNDSVEKSVSKVKRKKKKKVSEPEPKPEPEVKSEPEPLSDSHPVSDDHVPVPSSAVEDTAHSPIGGKDAEPEHNEEEKEIKEEKLPEMESIEKEASGTEETEIVQENKEVSEVNEVEAQAGSSTEPPVSVQDCKDEVVEKLAVRSDVESDGFSSDLDTDFEEDLKPPPAPRPPPMYDSEDGDIESGPENEDFNQSAMSNEPLRDFESSREISRDFESSREIDDSVQNQSIATSVETSTGTPGGPSSVNPASVNPYKIEIDSVGKESEVPEVPAGTPHPSQSSVPPTPTGNPEFETHVSEEPAVEPLIKTQNNDENTQSSMPEVDKDYVGRFFEEIQCTPAPQEDPISRMNSIEDNTSKSVESIEEPVPREDSGVPSSLTSSQTESSLQMQTPPTDMSHKRMEILASDRQHEEHYQPRSDSANRPPERIPGVYDQFNILDPYASTLQRDSVLRQNESLLVPSSSASSFMRFPESEAMLQRQRMAAPYDRNIQNLHRITESALPQHNSASPLLRRSNPVPGREEMFPTTATGVPGSMPRNPFHSSWAGQDVRPPHWGHPTYLQRPLDQQAGPPSSSLFKDNYLPGREFMFDPSRSVAERNMFSSLSSSQTQRPDLPHDTFQFDRFDLGSYLSSHGYPSSPSLPVDYTRGAHSSTQKSLDERYRQSTTGMTDLRPLPQSSSTDMFGSINMNSSFNLEKYVYPRDPVYHPQHITDNTNSAFLTHGVPAQHAMFGRDYPRTFYPQNTPYSFVNMNEKQYAASAKLSHSSSAISQDRDIPRPSTAAPESQIQDPYRHHSTMLYNMMNRYFE